MKLSRERDGGITRVVTGTILNRESATLASPGGRQAHKCEQRGYFQGARNSAEGSAQIPVGRSEVLGLNLPRLPLTHLGLTDDASSLPL